MKAISPTRLGRLPRRAYRRLKAWYFKQMHQDYSQAGETVSVRELLGKRKGEGGFFVELGANDGVTVSTTYGLLKDGWSGVAVEANPAIFARLQANWRAFPQARTLCLAVAPARGTVRLYLGRNDPQGMLSTISTESSAWFEQNRSEDFVEVPGLPLTELLDEQGVPRVPDLLLVDTEGMDYDILQTLDFQKYRPRLLITEDYEPKNDAKFALLERAGYRFDRRVGANTFWLDGRT